MASITTTTMVVFLFLFLLCPSFSEAQSGAILYSGETLHAGDYLVHMNLKFIMQEDCNLVLYEDMVSCWASNTSGVATDCHCALQRDGNLVVYKSDGSSLWSSKTDKGTGNYVLILQKDRNVVLYGGSLWATNTNPHSLNSKRGDAGAMDVVSIPNLPSSVIYTDGIDPAKSVTAERITTRAGRVA